MKTYYPKRINDLKFQIDYVKPRKIKLPEKYDENLFSEEFFVTLITQKD